jgi:hypothetical protein
VDEREAVERQLHVDQNLLQAGQEYDAFMQGAKVGLILRGVGIGSAGVKICGGVTTHDQNLAHPFTVLPELSWDQYG